MGSIIKGLLLGLAAAAMLMLVWFGLGSWMRSQPSNLLYYGGSLLDIIVCIPVVYMFRAGYNKISDNNISE